MTIEAPAWGLLTIFALFSFAFLSAWQTLFRATLGPALRKIGNVGWSGVHGIGSAHPLRFLVHTADFIDGWTARGIQASERSLTYTLNKLIESAALLIGLPVAIALALLELAHYARHTLPHTITKTIHTTVVRPITRTVTVIKGTSAAAVRHLTARINVLAARVSSIAHTAGHAIAQPFPRIGRLEKRVEAQGKRLTRTEKALAAGLGVALLARALARMGLGWLRCSNVTKAGKRVCGLDSGLLDALLIGTTLMVGSISLREFAKEVGAVTEEASGLIHGFIRDA